MRSKKLFVLCAFFLISFLLLIYISSVRQTFSSSTIAAIDKNTNLNLGINVHGWFLHPGKGGFIKENLDSWITEEDFRHLSKTKIDHIRLPIDTAFLQQQAPPYKINNQNFSYIDKALQWAQKYNLSIIIDIHPDKVLDLQAGVQSQAYKNLDQLWIEIAQRYRSQPQTVFFELLNEPGVNDSRTWHEIAQKLAESIRRIDQKHTLIVPAPGMSGPSEITNLIPISDDNTIYTFHFYSPLVFTHQKVFWVPALSQINDIPYPYNGKSFEHFKQTINDPLVLRDLEQYERRQYSKLQLAEDLQAVLQFRDRYKVPVYCGEFGVYDAAPKLDKYRWLQDITQILREKNIGYALWNYPQGFGTFDDKTDDYDWRLNYDWKLFKASGLN